jgi:hypothetical protein
MNNKTNSAKSMYTIVGIIVFAALAYFFFAPAAPQSDSLLQAEKNSDPDSSASATRILSLLNQVESLRINTTIFKSEAYRSFIDYTVEIPVIPIGRPNPFAPLPGAPAITPPPTR